MLQNGLASANIKAGELLQIQIQTSKVEQRHERRIFYKVKPGDSLYLIAERFSISVKQIKQMSRAAQGVRVMKLSSEEEVSAFIPIKS